MLRISTSLQYGMADLDKTWVHRQSCTSGVGMEKPHKNGRVCHYTMGTTAQIEKLQNLRAPRCTFFGI